MIQKFSKIVVFTAYTALSLTVCAAFALVIIIDPPFSFVKQGQSATFNTQEDEFGYALPVAEEKTEQNIAVQDFVMKKVDPQDEETMLDVRMVRGEFRDIKMVFVGDIMLGRYVETLMNKHGLDYAFELMPGFFERYDLAMGNLEGPINQNHKQTQSYTFRFSFQKEVAGLLKDQGFDVLNLANNHAFDHGLQGYKDTVIFLTDEELQWTGHYNEVSKDYILKKNVKGQPFVFLGINATYPGFDSEAALDLIEDLRQNSSDFIVINIHWGNEYNQLSNVRQQKMAHDMVNKGADLIIGHHPHVVQEIEEYQGKLIFYSLGNFIFDQYFSADVQEELAVDLEFQEEGIVYTLLPIKSQNSQPRLMDDEQARIWLANLAERSDLDLAEEIKAGRISK